MACPDLVTKDDLQEIKSCCDGLSSKIDNLYSTILNQDTILNQRLDVILSSFNNVNQRIDNCCADLARRIDNVLSKILNEFSNLNQRIDVILSSETNIIDEIRKIKLKCDDENSDITNNITNINNNIDLISNNILNVYNDFTNSFTLVNNNITNISSTTVSTYNYLTNFYDTYVLNYNTVNEIVNNTYNQTINNGNVVNHIDNSINNLETKITNITNIGGTVTNIENEVTNIRNSITNITYNIEQTNNNTIQIKNDVEQIKEDVTIDGCGTYAGDCIQPSIEGEYFIYRRQHVLRSNTLQSALVNISYQIEQLHADACKAIQPKIEFPAFPVPYECKYNEEKKKIEVIPANYSDEEDEQPPDWILEGYGNNRVKGIASWVMAKIFDNYWESIWQTIQKRDLIYYCLESPSDIVALTASEADLDSVEGNQLKLRFIDGENYPIMKKGDSIWEVQVPYALDEYDWDEHFKDLEWFRGEQYAYLELYKAGSVVRNDDGEIIDGKRIKVPVSGYFRSQEDADKYFDWILKLTQCEEYNRNYPIKKVKKLKPKVRKTKVHRAFLAMVKYPEGDVIAYKCYRPPLEE